MASSAKQADIRNLFGKRQGGGDDEQQEKEKEKRVAEKRKLKQKEYDKTKRKRSVQEKWSNEYPWIIEEDDKIYCSICKKYPSIADTKSSLYTGVASNFKKETFKFHGKSLKHKKCVEHQAVLNNPISSSIKKSAKKVDEVNSKKYEKLMNTAYYIAQEGKSFSSFSGLCNLQEKNGVILGQNYKNRQACKDFVSSVGDTMKSQSVESINNARFISILSDGATDKSVTEQEIVYVRYVDKNGKLNTKLADIVQLDHGHAQGVTDGIFRALETVGLSVKNVSEKLVGINTDGASVNMGKKGGAVKLMMDTINEQQDIVNCEDYMVVVHCIAHNLELAVCDSKKGCAYLDKFEETLKGIFKFYYYSPKKRRELYNIAEALDKELKHFGGIQQIRWVASQKRALKSLLDNYEVTCIHLGEIASKTGDDASRARGYLKEIKTERFLVFLHFMIDWIGLLASVSEAFQKSTCLLAEVNRTVTSLQDDFLHMKTRRGKELRSFLRINEQGDEFRGTAIERGGHRRILDSMEYINRDIDGLLDDAVFFLQERFIKHAGGEPHSFFNVFDFKCWPDKATHAEDFRTYGDDEIDKLVAVYSNFLTEDEQENAADQWLGLKNHIAINLNKTLTEAYQSLLGADNVERFSSITPLVNIMLTISPSTAECERGFSAMNALKTQGRTSLKQRALSSLMRVKVDGPNLADFNPTDSLVTWLNAGKGTRHTKGHKLSGKRGPRAKCASGLSSSDSSSDTVSDTE